MNSPKSSKSSTNVISYFIKHNYTRRFYVFLRKSYSIPYPSWGQVYGRMDKVESLKTKKKEGCGFVNLDSVPIDNRDKHYIMNSVPNIKLEPKKKCVPILIQIKF